MKTKLRFEPVENAVAADWLAEAKRRARELDEGTVQPVSDDEVRRKIWVLLRSAMVRSSPSPP